MCHVCLTTAEYQDVLGAQRLMLGGPVSLDTLSVLHRYRGLPGSVFVAEGLYLGGLNSAVELIQVRTAYTCNATRSTYMQAPYQDSSCIHYALHRFSCPLLCVCVFVSLSGGLGVSQ